MSLPVVQSTIQSSNLLQFYNHHPQTSSSYSPSNIHIPSNEFQALLNRTYRFELLHRMNLARRIVFSKMLKTQLGKFKNFEFTLIVWEKMVKFRSCIYLDTLLVEELETATLERKAYSKEHKPLEFIHLSFLMKTIKELKTSAMQNYNMSKKDVSILTDLLLNQCHSR